VETKLKRAQASVDRFLERNAAEKKKADSVRDRELHKFLDRQAGGCAG
jgi:hypothetical protein